MEVVGDELVLSVSHGCGEHAYGLCYSDEWQESYPVQVGITVLHDAGGDLCDALLTEELRFDLTPLREQYEQMYQSESGAIELQTDGSGAVYEFGDDGFVLSWESIDATIESFNHCEVVDDCTPIGTRPCEDVWINADEDTSQLEVDIAARNAADGNTDTTCTMVCWCGILTCTGGKCTTANGDCTEPSTDEQRPICL
jgi:hypothetical protein